MKRKIVDGQVLIQETTVYNLTVEIFHDYIANGNAV